MAWGSESSVSASDDEIDALLDRLEAMRVEHPDLTFAELAQQNAEIRCWLDQHADLASEVERRFRAIDVFDRHLARETDTEKAPEVPGYEILGLLGSGGVGVVYRARQLSLGREVALKVVLAGKFASSRTRERFRIEAAAAARLRHPHIVHVYESGEVDGLPFLVQELVEGGTLAEKVAGRPQPPQPAAKWVATIADAVEHAHQSGIIHRDLKPSNVLVSLGGLLKVADFGLAKLLDAQTEVTRTGESLGTVQYMAPEQIQGITAGAATDVYGLGAILYELLTGRAPFVGSTIADTIQQLQSNEAIPPRTLVAAVPRDLDAVVMRCLAKNPRGRYASAADLAADLNRFLHGRPTAARPLGSLTRVTRWAQRRPAVASLLGFSVLATLTILVGSLWYSLRLSDALAETESKRNEAETRRQQVEQQQSKLRRHLYAADMPAAARSWKGASVGYTLTLLDRHRPKPGEADLRGFAWHYLNRLCHSERLCFEDLGGEMFATTFSEDGKQLAAGGHDGIVRVWDSQTGTQLHTLRGQQGEVNCVAFSPDGRYLYSGGEDGALRVWDLAGPVALENKFPSGLLGRVLVTHASAVLTVAISADGRFLATGARDRLVKISDSSSGSERWSLAGHSNDVSAVAFSPDNSRLASAGHDRVAHIWNLADGTRVEPPLMHPDEVYSVAYAPDGKSLATACANGELRLWDSEKHELLGPVLNAHRDRAEAVVFADQGRFLVSAGKDSCIRIWDVESRRLHGAIHGHTDWTWALAASRDGDTIASASSDGTIRVWDLNAVFDPQLVGETDSEICALASCFSGGMLAVGTLDGRLELWPDSDGQRHLLKPPGSAVRAIAFTTDEQKLAAADEAGLVHIWDLRTRKLGMTLCGQVGSVQSLAFSADGRKLAVGCGDREPTPHVWNLSSSPASAIPIPVARGTHVVCPRNGRQLIVIDDFSNRIRTWDWQRERTNAELVTDWEKAGYLGCSSDGRMLAFARHLRGIDLWDIQSGNHRGTLPEDTTELTAAAFSQDGQTLATAGSSGVVRLWSLVSLQEIMLLANLENSVTRLEFSRNRLIACTTTRDGRGQIYEWKAGANIAFSPTVGSELIDNEVQYSRFSRDSKVSPYLMNSSWRALLQQHELLKPGSDLVTRPVVLPTFCERVVKGVLHYGGIKIAESMDESSPSSYPVYLANHELPIKDSSVAEYCRVGDEIAQSRGLDALLFSGASQDNDNWLYFSLPPDAAERRSIPAHELSAHPDWVERYRAVQKWAVDHGFVGGFPTFNDTTNDGSTDRGVVLIKPGCGKEVWIPANASR